MKLSDEAGRSKAQRVDRSGAASDAARFSR